jgi:lysophospholipase L1-like esterase
MLDAQPDLESDIPGIDVDAVMSRQWDTGVSLVEEMRADRTLGSIVIIDLGTNGPVDVEQFQQMMAALSGAALVVFVTVHLPPSYSWATSVNETLEAEVPQYKDARLADFNALANANPQWFGPDGVHMAIGGTGAQAMARLIASEI